MIRFSPWFASMLILSLVGASPAQSPKVASGDNRWAKAQGVSEKEIERLRDHKFVITATEYKQVFTPYIGSEVPVFITSDSLHNGFHVLLEESIYRMEQAHARKLPGLLDDLIKRLDPARKSLKGDAELIEGAHQRAAIFLGTARHLLDRRSLPEDPGIRKLVEVEAARVIAGKEKHKPAWLGAPDDGFRAIDYTRFQPRGFYTKTPAMERHFLAISWLQAIPFRLERDEELATFLLLRKALGKDDDKLHGAMWTFCRAFSAFLGSGDDWDLFAVDVLPEQLHAEGLNKLRESYRARATSENSPQLNDQLRFAPLAPDGKIEIGFRFLSAFRLPDAVMLQRTIGKRDFPGGLDVCAFLGSPYARTKLTKDMPTVMEEIDRCRPLLPRLKRHERSSLYADYLRCLQTLLERTEHDAPAFMHQDAWRIKTCQTALAGWAQMRHTWALQAKQSVTYMSAHHEEAGFIEPVPEFYTALAALAERTRQTLKDAGAFDTASTIKEGAEQLRAAKKIVEKASKDKKGISALTLDEIRLLAQFTPGLNDWETRPNPKDGARELNYLQTMLETFRPSKDEEFAGLFGYLVGGVNSESYWEDLVVLCRELERMSHKQLRMVPWDDKEEAFVRGYGKRLAGIMGYSGHAYGHARDDAPRIVDVFSNAKVGKHLLVGIAKPCAMWVLYPFKDKEIFCRGAVLPYREFVHHERLTNVGWRAFLNSPDRPAPPAFLQPIAAADSKQPR
ncbi:unnamed protein product [uncultured bacterium]|nr:unnamed protein product [uncultured bacterium]